MSEDHRTRYKQRMIAQNRCYTCGRKKAEHSKRCYICLDKDAERKRIARNI